MQQVIKIDRYINIYYMFHDQRPCRLTIFGHIEILKFYSPTFFYDQDYDQSPCKVNKNHTAVVFAYTNIVVSQLTQHTRSSNCQFLPRHGLSLG